MSNKDDDKGIDILGATSVIIALVVIAVLWYDTAVEPFTRLSP